MGNRIIKILNKSSNANYHAIAATFLEDLDVQAYDTRYHLSCLVSEERKSFASDGKETLTIARVLADIEIVNIVKFSIDRGDVLTMNDINQEYKYILQENNAADIVDNYKKHICGLLRQKIPYVQINPSHRRTESHRVSSQRTVSAALNKYEEAGDPEDEVQTLMNAAMIYEKSFRRTSHGISKAPLMILNFQKNSTCFAGGLFRDTKEPFPRKEHIWWTGQHASLHST